MDYELLQFVTDVTALQAISIDVLDSVAVTGFTMNMNTIIYDCATSSLQFTEMINIVSWLLLKHYFVSSLEWILYTAKYDDFERHHSFGDISYGSNNDSQSFQSFALWKTNRTQI